MTLRAVDTPSPSEMQAAFALRHRVFVEEQHVPPDLERDALDITARHVLLFDDTTLVATGRILLTRSPAKVQRVAVAPPHRKKGIGRTLMTHLEGLARQAGHPAVTLASQLTAVPFYKRLGYHPRGDIFQEAGIPHIWMDKPF